MGRLNSDSATQFPWSFMLGKGLSFLCWVVHLGLVSSGNMTRTSAKAGTCSLPRLSRLDNRGKMKPEPRDDSEGVVLREAVS